MARPTIEKLRDRRLQTMSTNARLEADRTSPTLRTPQGAAAALDMTITVSLVRPH